MKKRNNPISFFIWLLIIIGMLFIIKADNDKNNTNEQNQQQSYSYVLNKNTKKFHHTWCSSVKQMKKSNARNFTGTRDELIKKGYVPCKRCKP